MSLKSNSKPADLLTPHAQVHARSDASNRYLVVLDAAAFIPTHALDLSVTKPDFVPISFYKLFGYPSGLGALLVRREAAAALTKFYFGGGSVDYCTAQVCECICEQHATCAELHPSLALAFGRHGRRA